MSKVVKRKYYVKGKEYLAVQVFIAAPYKSQVHYCTEELNIIGGVLHSESFRNRELVLISTLNSSQGMQGVVVIIWLKRCNIRENIGFLTYMRELNVATSRDRHLLIDIGYSSTVCNSKVIRALWTARHRRLPGSVIKTMIKTIKRGRTLRDMEEEQDYQDCTSGNIRLVDSCSHLYIDRHDDSRSQ